jgi:hypothetical protein
MIWSVSPLVNKNHSRLTFFLPDAGAFLAGALVLDAAAAFALAGAVVPVTACDHDLV